MVLTAAALVVAGCSGGDDPPPAPTSRPVTSQTTTATTTTAAPSDIPAAARAHTPAGAVAFVRYFIDRVNYAWTTPQSGVVVALGEPGCLSCRALEKTATGLVKDGRRYARTPISLQKLAAVPGGPDGQQYVRGTMIQNRVSIVDRQGRVVSTDPRLAAGRTFALVWKEESWAVYDIAA